MREVAAALGVGSKLVSFYLSTMKSEGTIIGEGEHKHTVYRVAA